MNKVEGEKEQEIQMDGRKIKRKGRGEFVTVTFVYVIAQSLNPQIEM